MTTHPTMRTALITGAGSETGIGFATAIRLVNSGYKVIITATSERVLERAEHLNMLRPHSAHGVVANLTQENEVNSLFDSIAGFSSTLDVVVNNAGMTSVSLAADTEMNTAEQLTLDGWHTSLDRNLTSSFLVTRAALSLLRHSSHPRVVFVSSVTGPVMAMRNDAGYAAAKAGMVGLMRSLAVDAGEWGLTSNAVLPGWIATGSQLEHEIEEGQRVPLGRSGTPDEVAALIEFLVSCDAAYITGQTFVVDGGNSVQEERL